MADISPEQAAEILGTVIRFFKYGPSNIDVPASSTPPTREVNNLQLTSPVPIGDKFPIAGAFGEKRGGHIHGGVDIATPVGTNLISAINGVVTHAGNDDPGGYGSWVEITSPDGISVRYGHMSSIAVSVGQRVNEGATIGKSGGEPGAQGSGNSTGPHLHFEVRKAGTVIDPSPWIKDAVGEGTDAGVGEATTPTGPTTTPEDQVLGQLKNVTNVMRGEPATEGTGTTTTTTGITGEGGGGFFERVLAGIGAPVTPENLRALQAWQRAEGGSPDNPFNTSWDMPNSRIFNSHGVRRYASIDDGVTATINTLNNGLYQPILDALRSGNDAMAVGRAIAGSRWGSGDLVMKVLGG